MPTPAQPARAHSVSAWVIAAGARGFSWREAWRRRGWWLLAVLYVCGWSALSLIRLRPTDLERFYIPAALVALRGSPLLIYSVSHQSGYPLANGPLSIAPLVLALALAGWLGWLGNAAGVRLIVVAIYSVFSLLLAREAVGVIDRHTQAPLRGARRLLIYEALLVSLQLWQSMLFYGHVEQPLMLWLALVGIRALGEGKPRRAGVLLALALLTRTTALTIIIPLALLPLAQRDWRTLRRFSAALMAVVIGGLLPFALADGPDLFYSLVAFHSTEAVSGGNVWTLISGTALSIIPQRADGIVTLLATLVLAALVLRARPDLRVTSRDFFGLLTLCSLAHPAFVNILWPYYFLEAYTLCVIWWLSGMGARGQARTHWLLWAAAPVGITLLGQIRQAVLAQAVAASSFTPGAAWNLLTCCALIALMVALAWRLTRRVAPGRAAERLA